MHPINISRVDLNLFVVFDVIYREGNLTRASEQLNLSQPAVSHALNRLRERFNDPLFERAGKGMTPTPLAKAMIDRVRSALLELESTLSDGLQFEPSNAHRMFTLAARDMMESTALPKLMASLQNQAPYIQLRSIRVARREVANALAAGSIDFAVDVLLPVNEDIDHQAIGQEPLVVVMRNEHPLQGKSWDLDAYLSARHIQVSSRAEGLGVEDFALTRLGKARSVSLRCQSNHAAVEVVRNTDLVLTLPQSFARQLIGEHSGFSLRELPLSVAPLELHLYWHRKVNRDPAVMWLREQILAAF